MKERRCRDVKIMLEDIIVAESNGREEGGVMKRG